MALDLDQNSWGTRWCRCSTSRNIPRSQSNFWTRTWKSNSIPLGTGGGAGGCHAPPNNHNNKAGAGGGGVEGSYVNPNAGAPPIASDATPYAGGGNGGYGRGNNTSRNGDDGMMNTGGGGGGGGTSVPEGTNGGRGGAGLVMIAYPT